MQLNQAILIIRQVLDQAIKSGNIQNMEQASAVIQAWSLIIKELEQNSPKQV